MKPYKIGFTAGSYDCIHYGHILLLQRAKSLCEKLYVAVSTDDLIKEQKGIEPVMMLAGRMAVVNELKCVDLTVIQYNLIDIEQFNTLQCNVFFIGTDWEHRTDSAGLNWLRANNKVIFLPYTKTISSSTIKERIINNSEAILKAQRNRNK